MDGLQEFLLDLKARSSAQGNFLGFLNVLIGRKIQTEDGVLLSPGMNWRQASEWLKKVRWDKEAVQELGIDPESLPPRDRQRYWFLAIVQAQVDSPAAIAAGDRLAAKLRKDGYVVG